jgi:molybdenum cofactor biosynthesis enzyme MoaA
MPERLTRTAQEARALPLHGRIGEIGVIASVTQPSRRLHRAVSAEALYTCLFATRGHDLRALLRSDKPDDEIAEFLRSVWTRRDDRYSELRSSATPGLPKVEMSRIGARPRLPNPSSVEREREPPAFLSGSAASGPSRWCNGGI